MQFLKDEFVKRNKKNPRYSLRSFAKSLSTNVGTLSSIMSGKRPLTVKTALKFCDKLNAHPLMRKQIIQSVSESHLKDSDIEALQSETTYLEQDVFAIIADWQHYAILQLVELDIYGKSKAQQSSRWIAKQLGLQEMEAGLAIQRLIQLGLLVKDKAGYLKRTKQKLDIKDKNITKPALINLQKQIREKAIVSLENDPIENRVMNSITMAIDAKKLEQARELIGRFQDELSVFLENGEKNSVYQLCISLYPLTGKGEVTK